MLFSSIFIFFLFLFWGTFYKDGSLYEGEWKHDKKDGHGNKKYFNFEEEDPFFICFLFWGRFHSTDNSLYEGEWTNDKKDGQGDRKCFSCQFWRRVPFFYFILFFFDF